MHMTFEKIEAPSPISIEHPAYRAARMIKELHEENIAKIAGGHVFLRDGVDVSEEVRRASAAQIELCDQIMKRAENMDPKHWAPAALILDEVQATLGGEKANDALDCSLPEIGNYGHGN
jgi:hypothetical protein